MSNQYLPSAPRMDEPINPQSHYPPQVMPGQPINLQSYAYPQIMPGQSIKPQTYTPLQVMPGQPIYTQSIPMSTIIWNKTPQPAMCPFCRSFSITKVVYQRGMIT